MHIATINTIKSLIDNDSMISSEMRRNIIGAINNRKSKPKLITKKQVAEILDCSTKTVERMVADKIIEPIRFSAKRHRYNEDQIIELAHRGVK